MPAADPSSPPPSTARPRLRPAVPPGSVCPGPRRLAVGLATLALVGAGCAPAGNGAENGATTAGGPTIAPAELGGRWTVTAVDVDGRPSADPITALVQLESEFGGAEIDTDCGTSIGAFTLDADGAAGFSLTGGSTVACAPDVAAGRQQLLAVLEEVDGWRGDDDRIELTTPDGSMVELSR